MDLIAEDRRRKRATVQVTVLRREQGWTDSDVEKITALGIITSANVQHPTVLMICPWVNKETILGAVDFDNFEHEIVTGFDLPTATFDRQ